MTKASEHLGPTQRSNPITILCTRRRWRNDADLHQFLTINRFQKRLLKGPIPGFRVTAYRCESRPKHRSAQVYRSSDRCCESNANALSSNRHAAPCGRQTTAPNILCKARRRSPDRARNRSLSIPIRFQSFVGIRMHYRHPATRGRRHIRASANPNSLALV